MVDSFSTALKPSRVDAALKGSKASIRMNRLPDLIQMPMDFDRLVREYQDGVMGLAHSMGLRGADLDDAAAESFAAVFRALPGFKGESAIGTWIYRIAWRSILKTRSRRKREPSTDDAAEPQTTAEPFDGIEASETSRVLWSAVHDLEPMQAAAIELYYRREWPVQAIADVLGCPTGTVKTLLFRARAKLREKLARLEVYP